jgi:methionyl-tRNA synthetase
MLITYNDFKKLDLRVSLVINCERVPKSSNLFKLTVDSGEDNYLQIITGIARFYEPEDLIGKKIIVLTNLKPRKIMGIESQGMLLAADVENEPFLLKIDEKDGKEIPAGTIIK